MKTITFFVIAVVLFSCNDSSESFQLTCEQKKQAGIIDSFSYPIQPGSTEWAQLSNWEEKRKAVSVPDEILKNMCTHGLVYTCVQCPLYFDIWAFNSKQNGFEMQVKGINSFAELNQRDDAGREFFDYYRSLKPSVFDKTWSTTKQGDFSAQIYITEIYLSRQAFLMKLPNAELVELVKEAHKKYFEKKEYGLGRLCETGSYFLISHILYHNFNYKPLVEYINRANLENSFMMTFLPLNDQLTDSLSYHTERFLETH